MGAAWALRKSGFEVDVFEKKPTLGGNAKAHTWSVPTADGSGAASVRTGLSVLAWPSKLFHTYGALLRAMQVRTVEHTLRFFVGKPLPVGGAEVGAAAAAAGAYEAGGEYECVYAHDRASHARAALARNQPWLADDLQRWRRLTAFVRRLNGWLAPAPAGGKSVYRSSVLNPLNLVPLRALAQSFLFGVSARFWEEVFVPVHTSTFLEASMDDLPAVIVELLEDIVPLAEPERAPVMATWAAGHAGEVFERLAAPLEEGAVHTSTEIERVRFALELEPAAPAAASASAPASAPGAAGRDVRVAAYATDDEGVERRFDHVIFACGAPAAARALGRFDFDAAGAAGAAGGGLLASLRAQAAQWAAVRALRNVQYVESRDAMFSSGEAHSDASRVLPPAFREELLDRCCNYVEVQRGAGAGGGVRYENSFIISSWCPPALEPRVKGQRAMLVSYNCRAKLKAMPAAHFERNVTGREAHPCLTMRNLLLSSLLWPWLQGLHRGTAFFCGSAVTPGNGHDLSLLSGLVVARAIGAAFPFGGNAAACFDFKALQAMMGLPERDR
eukprot:g463.t1